jgi:hypothetical protein
MISLWITIGLVIAAALVSTLGAYFSVVGIGALFSGALVAVWLMAASLEFAKFVLAAYLHQTWRSINLAFKIYMTFAVVTLSLITSIGVFGFLSDAYQSASTVLEAETIKIENLKKQQEIFTAEIERLNYSVEEIPEERISKRLAARQAIEPKILELNKKFADGEKAITESNLHILEVKKKVGPLIYIARSMNIPIDKVVQYLILIFVSVFDPLAICLVIASTYSIESRRKGYMVTPHHQPQPQVVVVDTKLEAVSEELKPEEKKTEAPVPAAQAKVEQKPAPVKVEDEDIVVQMNFKDEAPASEEVKDDTKKDDSKVV